MTLSIEEQYQNYLKKVKLDEKDMAPEQKSQLRTTFYAACGQMLLYLRDEVGQKTELEAMKEMQGLVQEAADYFAHIQRPKN